MRQKGLGFKGLGFPWMLGRSEVQTLIHRDDYSLAVGQHPFASTESSKLLKAQMGDSQN